MLCTPSSFAANFRIFANLPVKISCVKGCSTAGKGAAFQVTPNYGTAGWVAACGVIAGWGAGSQEAAGWRTAACKALIIGCSAYTSAVIGANFCLFSHKKILEMVLSCFVRIFLADSRSAFTANCRFYRYLLRLISELQSVMWLFYLWKALSQYLRSLRLIRTKSCLLLNNEWNNFRYASKHENLNDAIFSKIGSRRIVSGCLE